MAVLRNKKGFTRKRDWVQKSMESELYKFKYSAFYEVFPDCNSFHLLEMPIV